MARTRSGSFLLFSIALVSVMVAFGFALLQIVRLQTDAGVSSQRNWLAQEAAVAGLHHAMENIVLDYQSGHKGATYLDGIWHRDFYPAGWDQNQPGTATVSGADDDVRKENPIWTPLIERNDRGFWEYGNGLGEVRNNLYQYESRARYFEVDYYTPSDPTYAVATRPNLTATRVTDAAAATPTRAGAVFLDAKLNRLVPVGAETTAAQRARARYRLRYAVITNDAGSGILINPALDLDYNDAWRPGDAAVSQGALGGDPVYGDAHYATYGAVFAPTALGRRLERYRHSLFNMLACGTSGGYRGYCARMEDIFALRGGASNLARNADGWPVAFPTMFRNWKDKSGTGQWRTSWAEHANQAPFMAGVGLFRAKVGAGGDPRLEGGQTVTQAQVDMDYYPSGLNHVLTGPQYSYRNIQAAMAGDHYDGDNPDTGMSSPVQARSLATPFGRASELGTKSAPVQWNRGPTDVPWTINVLTAPAGTITAMIRGYLPPAFSTYPAQLCVRDCLAPDATPTAEATVSTGATIPAAGRGVYSLYYARDLFTDFMSPAFMRWPAPQGRPQYATNSGGFPVSTPAGYTALPVADHGPSLWPNFYIPDPRTAVQVYPGRYATFSRLASGADQAMENTGRYINAGTAYVNYGGGDRRVEAYDCHSPNLLVVDRVYPAPNGEWDGNNKKWSIPLWGTLPLGDSFFLDMEAAFATAIGVLRAHWVEVKNPWLDPAASFPNGKDLPAETDSVAQLDRLFLKQLGIDINNPSANAVTASWAFSTTTQFPRLFKKDQLTLSNNIRTLVTGDKLKDPAAASLTSVMRARAMELMLNDWRMSFLGSSPDYYATFHPLDFDGDGYAICSAYAASRTFADDVGGVTWPCQAAVAGQGPTLGASDHPFSLTGCFTMSKSRYYRVMVRGELWDNQVRRAATSTTLEAVLCVDPNGLAASSQLNHDCTVLYQRWYWNSYNGLLPSIYP